MSLQRLAPQAYTKETLIKAFEWLQSQNDSIKSVATSVDALISLYMKAKLQGEESLHRISIKNFKNDLQHLASIVGDWERTSAQPPQAMNPQVSTAAAEASNVAQPPSSRNMSAQHHSSLTSKPVVDTQAVGSIECSSLLPTELQRDLAELTRAFHLSHPDETLRMALRIGIEQLKKLVHRT